MKPTTLLLLLFSVSWLALAQQVVEYKADYGHSGEVQIVFAPALPFNEDTELAVASELRKLKPRSNLFPLLTGDVVTAVRFSAQGLPLEAPWVWEPDELSPRVIQILQKYFPGVTFRDSVPLALTVSYKLEPGQARNQLSVEFLPNIFRDPELLKGLPEFLGEDLKDGQFTRVEGNRLKFVNVRNSDKFLEEMAHKLQIFYRISNIRYTFQKQQ